MTEKNKKAIPESGCILSSNIIKLYNSATVQNVNEAATVLFHAFLLESGFTPKDVSNKDKYQFMPENWNTSTVFKIKYVHSCCPSFTCCMTCVPLYSTVSVHGIVCDMDCPESIDFKVNVNKYLKQKRDFSNVFEVFCSLDELSRHFKDNFSLPLLNLLHETIGRSPLYGMLGLMDELKMYILEYLPVEGVVLMSAVNKTFHSLANSNFLWKYLFQRDFKKGTNTERIMETSENNWKQLYKKEYLKRIRKQPAIFRFPHNHFSQMIMVPDHDTDLGIRFDPPFPDVYPPFMQPSFPFLRKLY